MAKSTRQRDVDREHRISMEVIVDAHDEQEQAIGWYNYLEDQLQFPFTATCIAQRAISPLRPKDEVEVVAMAHPDDCTHEMFVTIRWDRKSGLAVPLSQLMPINHSGEQTVQAVEDWHYWVRMGFEF